MVKTSQILTKFVEEYEKATVGQKEKYKDLYSIFQRVLPILKSSGR
ncbi:MAG: hypothetical protein ACFFBD_06200 [Candidatus Hodarchaeota archaeon]